MSNEITFNAKLSEAPRTQADFTYLQDHARGDFDWRYRLRQMLGERGYRGCLAQNPKSPCSFLRVATQNRRGNFRDNAAPDKSRLKIGRYNRQTSMYEALVETLEMV